VVITHVAEGDEGDIDLAVKTARKAFEEGPWSTMAAADRGKILWKIGDLVMKYADELAELETLDNGKPYSLILWAPETPTYPIQRSASSTMPDGLQRFMERQYQ
jgi:NAD-dependent aldehyde dehydrogenases